MGLPAKKRTKSSKGKRASHFALKKVPLSSCPHCGKPVLPHHVCPFCGYYKKEERVKIKIRTKKEKKKKKEEKK